MSKLAVRPGVRVSNVVILFHALDGDAACADF
jgi:hypothetical protein